jgi:hypothetical protein
MNQPSEQALIHANLTGFAVQCKQAGKTDAEIPGCIKRAQAWQSRITEKRAKLSAAILAGLGTPAPAAA